MNKIFLTKEEAAIEKEVDRGEWIEVPGMRKEIEKIRGYARNTLNKNKKVNIRISDWDYEKIKIKAAQEGLPYQTLISSLIHKYVSGRIKTI